MRSSEWRALPSAFARGARPDCTHSAITCTMVSRKESESAACTTSASGKPPSSCTRTIRSTCSTSSGSAPCSRSQAPTICAQRSWCQRLYSGSFQETAESQSPSG